MQYQISRNGQTFGPYTLEDLRRYVASGNIVLTDMAKSEEMMEWVPVSQLLAPAAPADETVPPAAPAFSTPSYGDPAYTNPGSAPMYGGPPVQQYPPQAVASSPYQDAPNLHWGLYLLLSIVTCTLFSKVFTCVQAAWLKSVQPNSKALLSYGVQYGILILSIAVRSMTHTLINNSSGMNYGFHMGVYAHQNPIVNLLNLLYFIMIFVSRFVMRGSLQEHFNTVEPIGLNLNPVMTFFFGGVYFQAELNRINAMKQAARFGGGRTY
jgi:hypothetical protein